MNFWMSVSVLCSITTSSSQCIACIFECLWSESCSWYLHGKGYDLCHDCYM